ncbi:MAG: DUF2336 domain-containing protein [Phreatobacter sp.]|uniref:DUF2336 domain-containing protein n=1 Tax=Phreatobacter sp. TaxID=1966341 RepID=UPI0027355E51|nr:DUF2336 domain-containing protein [Phreatobacter sp.]MDP2803275.1 DUF2336 domain-containing protein [Phreatobacter sp.]
MIPSLENPVEQVLAAVDQLPPMAQQALVMGILGQFGPDRPRPSAKAQERLDRIVAHLLPPMPIERRVFFARSFGALDLDLPRTFAAIEKDDELVAEISIGQVTPEPATILNLGKQRRFVDMRIMAEREDLTGEAAEALAEVGDARTVRTLAGNANVTLSSKAYGRLVTRASHDPQLQGQLCSRPELGPEDALRLALVVPDNLKTVLFERLDRDAVQEAQKLASEAIIAKVRRIRLHGDCVEGADELRQNVKDGTKSLAEALTLLAATDQVIPAVEMLGVTLDIKREALITALARGRIEPFEAMARAVALDENVYASLVGSFCRRWRKPAPDPRGLLRRYRMLTEKEIDAELALLRGHAPKRSQLRNQPAQRLSIPVHLA